MLKLMGKKILTILRSKIVLFYGLLYWMNFLFSVHLEVKIHNQYVFMVWVKSSVNPDQLASSESIWSGSTLFSIQSKKS